MEDAIMLVKNKGELPKLNDVMEFERALSEKIVTFKVKKIVNLKWNQEGDLIVSLKGNYISK